MARLVLLFALCLLPAIAVARNHLKPLVVSGRVYCDICRAGFEMEKTPGIAGALVRIDCTDRKKLVKTFTAEGVTDSTGTYTIDVYGDHKDDFCDAYLVKSPQADCSEVDAGRDRARVILTRSNGMTSNTRYANAMGFLKNEPLASCTAMLQKYQDTETDIYKIVY